MVNETSEREAVAQLDQLPCASHALPDVGRFHADVDQALNAALFPNAKTAAKKREGQSPQYQRLQWLAHARDHMTHLRRAPVVCEIGLNTGHSALAWLCGYPMARYNSFDLVRYNATRTALPFLDRAFPGRFTITAGSTHSTLKELKATAQPSAKVRCDIASIDGDLSFV
jgi:hypothetical protein